MTRTLDPVYVFCSAEPLLIERAVTEILDAAVPASARGFNYDLLQGRGGSAARILGAAQTLPMMAERRMVLVRDIAALPAAELTELLPYLEDPSPSTVLVMTAARADKRLKFFASAKKRGFLHELEPPRNLAGWIDGEARRRGVAIAAEARRRLADVVGSDLARLSLSLEQLALYAGGRAVEVDDVDDLIAETRERTVFELTDAIGAGDARRAHTAVAALCDQRQSAIGMVMMLARHMRQLGLVQVAVAERLPKGEMARRVGAPPFVVEKLQAQARRYTPAAISRALATLGEVDRSLKGQAHMMKALGRPLTERILLDRAVSALLALGR